ncbi:MAG: diacylglycerol kinase family lipid kinase [Chloroflexi bacterium]|nr:diacylglycerol kinase family lipid kinase [Chloroflexota bacterium]
MQEGMLESTAATTDQKTTAILIANPTSGSYTQHAHQIEETISFLRNHGWQAELRLTQAAGDAQRLAREAVEQRIDVVVAVGGDGTTNEIIQELAGSETALGVLPWGTVNVWAREVGIPLDNVGAQSVLINGLTRRIDLGKVNDRYFLLMTGIGFDGEVTHAVEKKPAKRLGVLGYLLVGTWLGLGYPAFRTSLEIDGKVVKISALQIIIGNTQLYGGALKYTWQAKCDDGLLDICILRKQSMLRRFMILLDFLLHRDQRKQWVRYEKCTTVKIRTRRSVAIQIDGDPMGYTPEGNAPTTFTIAPGVLKVIVPEQTPEELFSK